jgi:hypothetical protein
MTVFDPSGIAAVEITQCSTSLLHEVCYVFVGGREVVKPHEFMTLLAENATVSRQNAC